MAAIVVSALVALGADSPALGVPSRALVITPGDLAAPDAADLAGASHALVIGERRHEPLVRRHAAALADRGLPVAWRALPHGPGAILLIANQAAAVGLDAGRTVAFVDELARTTWSGAWTPTVAKLEHPAPSVGQHLRSWAPMGAGFVVTLSGTSPAVRAVGHDVAPDEPTEARGPLYGGAPEWIPEAARAHLLAASGCTEIVELDALVLDPAERFGTGRAVELVALPAARLQLPVPRGACPTCDTAVVTDFCPFCHVRRTDPVDSRGAIA
ncbi:hypothetical protein HP550_12900 [Cellulomonas humilata]|uniref:Uncharacterized protein n=1 Tax=Cellulomonas humilata TaxID=144055 RepID=A0A7Y6A1P5_9CELL|nr:hypothetical protein [Cellulomonas humilata]NUU18148.1 hypothetical protein [Cellulomonas humilata]